MNSASVDNMSLALLYEGYNLYPYRPSSLKNRHRWTFGVLYPESYCQQNQAGDASSTQTQCLIQGGLDSEVELTVRFLQLTPAATSRHSDWHETIERDVVIPKILLSRLVDRPSQFAFAYSADIKGYVKISADKLEDNLFRVTSRVINDADASTRYETRDDALKCSLLSVHTLLSVQTGMFISLIDPEECFREHTAACHNIGAWPVLIGQQGTRDRMLSAPIILYDYPSIAPESRGNLFDSTEIDEILSLRILTLTENEKREVDASDRQTRDLLQRTQATFGESLRDLHGAIRCTDPSDTFQPGDRVRLRPSTRADGFDVLLAGRIANVLSLEHDFEGQVYVTVTIDDDPGQDLGRLGQPGHRFFFRLDEVEHVIDESMR